MYGHKLMIAAKRSELKKCSQWSLKSLKGKSEGIIQSSLDYLHNLMNGSRFKKKSRRKSKHLRDLLHI